MTILNQEEMRDRLAKLAKTFKIRMPDVQLLLSQERFIARLASVDEKMAFIWKGGSLLLRLKFDDEVPRFTVDVDLVLKGEPMAKVDGIFYKAIAKDFNDGFKFLDFTKSSMERDLPYGGEQYSITWTFFGNPGPRSLKVDVAAGDVVKPIKMGADELFLIPMDSSQPFFNVYPIEYMLAEKIETIARFGAGSTRFKDFIDIYNLSKRIRAMTDVVEAVGACFKNRGTRYDSARLLGVLHDPLFIKNMEAKFNKDFKNLGIESAQVVFKEIEFLINKISAALPSS